MSEDKKEEAPVKRTWFLLRLIKWLAYSFVLALAAVLVVLINTDFNQHKPLLEDTFHWLTGHTLSLKGPVEIDLSLTPLVDVQQASIKNVPSDPVPMAHVGHLRARFSLTSLLFGDHVQVNTFVLTDTRLVLQTSAKGHVYVPFLQLQKDRWFHLFSRAQADPLPSSKYKLPFLPPMLLKKGTLSKVTLILNNKRRGQATEVHIQTLTGAVNPEGVTRFQGKNVLIRHRGPRGDHTLLLRSLQMKRPAPDKAAHLRLDTLFDKLPLALRATLLPRETSFDITGSITAGKALVTKVQGTLDRHTLTLDMRASLAGPLGSLEPLLNVTGIPGNIDGSVHIKGHLPNALSFKELALQVGEPHQTNLVVYGDIATIKPLSGVNVGVAFRSEDISRLSTLVSSIRKEGFGLPPVALPALGHLKASAQIKGGQHSLELSSLKMSLEHQKVFHMDLKGSLHNLLGKQSLDVTLKAHGDDLPTLMKLLRLQKESPPGPFDLQAQFQGDASVLSANNILLSLGKSHIEGGLTLRSFPAFLRARLKGTTVRAEDIAMPAALGAGASSAPPSPQPPSSHFSLERLKDLNGDVTLSIDHLTIGHGHFSKVQGHIFLQDGVLRLDHTSVDDKALALSLSLDTLGNFKTDVKAQSFQVEKLFQAWGIPSPVEGASLSVNAELLGQGRSFQNMLESLDGYMNASLLGGHLNALSSHNTLEGPWSPLRALLLAGKRKGSVPLGCSFVSMTSHEGKVHVKGALLRTALSTLLGKGEFDVGKELLDMVILPRRVIGFPLPPFSLHLTGTFSQPKLAPDSSLPLTSRSHFLPSGLPGSEVCGSSHLS